MGEGWVGVCICGYNKGNIGRYKKRKTETEDRVFSRPIYIIYNKVSLLFNLC